MERQNLLNSICQTTADYRAGDLEPPTPAHIERWVSQFDESLQMPILAEMDHVLRSTYFSKNSVTNFLQSALSTEQLTGEDPCDFWSKVQILDIQGGGNSQRELNVLLEEILINKCGLAFNTGNSTPDKYVYLDDGIFTGNRVRRDLEDWIESHAPARCHIHVVCIASHKGGQHYAEQKVLEKIRTVRKNIEVTWWHKTELESRLRYCYSSDVLWPTAIPENNEVQNYINNFRYPLNFRSPGSTGSQKIFSSEEGRSVLEQAFLVSGVHIRQVCPNLGNTQRPLGHMTLESLGFGSLVVTYRNCPNNAPLALWAGDPWYPLFPRTTNTQTANRNFFSSVMANGF